MFDNEKFKKDMFDNANNQTEEMMQFYLSKSKKKIPTQNIDTSKIPINKNSHNEDKQVGNNVPKVETSVSDKLSSLLFGMGEKPAKGIAKTAIKSIDDLKNRYNVVSGKEDVPPLEKYKLMMLDSYADDGVSQKLLNSGLGRVLLGSHYKNSKEDVNFINQEQYKKYKTDDELQKAVDAEAQKYRKDENWANAGNTIEDVGLPLLISALGIPSPLAYGVSAGINTYGDTNDSKEILSETAKGTAWGFIDNKVSKIAGNVLGKTLPNAGKKILPTVIKNAGERAIGSATASVVTDVGGNIVTGKENDWKQIGQHALTAGATSGVLGGITGTIKDVSKAKIQMNKDVYTTVQKLQDVKRQITKGDASISKNPKIILKLISNGQKEIDSLSNNNYLLQDKKLKNVVDKLQLAYKTGNLKDITENTNKITALLNEKNSKIPISQEASNIKSNLKQMAPLSEQAQLKYDIDQGIIKKIDKKTVSERLQLPTTNSLEVSTQLPTNNIIPQKENYASTMQNNVKIPINKELVKTDDMLYNNIKSDGDINGREATELSRFQSNDRRRVQRLSSNQTREENSQGYIRETYTKGTAEETKLTNRLAKEELINYAMLNKLPFESVNPNIRNIAKDLGIDLVVYKNGKTDYSGLTKDKSIYLDKESGVRDEEVFSHELLHWLKRNGNIIYANEIEPIVNEIANDSYSDVLFEYAKSTDLPIVSLNDNMKKKLAEEVVADYSSKILSGFNIEYGLKQSVIEKLKKSLFKITNGRNLKEDVLNVESNANSEINGDSSYKIELNNKSLNPIEISNLSEKDITTTPKLPNISNNIDNRHKSEFYNNLMYKTNMLNDDLKGIIKNEDDIKYYEGVTNSDVLAEAYNRLNENGSKEVIRWMSKDLSDKNVKVSATEVAEGWILLKQYQDAKDYDSAVNVAKKMRDMATKSGQALQAFSIQARLTPEGMLQYAQSELSEAFQKFSTNKTKEWIQENSKNFDLSSNEADAIVQKVKEAQELPENSYEKKVKLAEIQKIMTDKLPPERGDGIKAWMRISMLFNPKTQVRNVLGNTVILPVNVASDFVSSIADKAIAKKTGVRTTGNINIVNYAKGFKKGIYESYNDFKNDINTRDINGNRFEIGKGKSFKNNGLGKTLNGLDHVLSFTLDAGDRGYYEATFTNSINNQLKLNNTDVVTKDMIDIATNEALSRTWQDNNAYTNAVLNIRKSLNKFNINSYGLGDVFIPFAKTPANLTKAIIDYSPIGVVNTIIEGNNLKKSIERGDFTAQQQHKFVQDLGKATAGTMLYILGYALAKAGITVGDSDEDKDVANFMKNTLGTSQYSIKIGDKSYTYDWAQPVSAPFAMMANLVGKKKENTDTLNNVLDTLDVPMNLLLEQSFMSSIKNVFSNTDGLADGIFQEISALPSRAVPTLFKQVADMIDTTQRSTFEKGKPIETAVNQVKSKIPGLSKTLAPVSNTLGEDVKKYGGETNPFLYAFNVFANPSNVNSQNVNKAGSEIYRVYKKTGDKTIFPRQTGYNQIIDGENITLTSNEKYQYQKTSGKYVSDVVNNVLSSKTYKALNDNDKSKILKEIVSDSNEKAKEELAKNKELKYERSKTDIKIEDLTKKGLEYSNSYIFKTLLRDISSDKDADGKAINCSVTSKKAKYIMDMNTDDSQKDMLLSLVNDSDTKITAKELKKLKGNYLTYLQQSGNKNKDGISKKEEYMSFIDLGINVNELNRYYNNINEIESSKYSNGKTISGSKKNKISNYINSLNISANQKMILYAKQGYGNSYKHQIFNYINSQNIPKSEKEKIWNILFN